MRALFLLAGLALCGFADPVLAQTAEPRPRVAVVVVTLDEARQGQIKHGRIVLDSLGDDRFGRYRLVEPAVPLDDFRSCEDDAPEGGLAFCARFSLHRGPTPETPPYVVVVFTDNPDARPRNHRGTMRALCYGRGDGAVDASAQDTWLWPGSAQVHGVNDWNRDQDALAACIDAALSETPGEPKPAPL